MLCQGGQPSVLDADLQRPQGQHRSQHPSLWAEGTLGEAPQSWACGGPWGEPSGAHTGLHGWYLLHAGMGLAVLTRSSSQQSLLGTSTARCSHHPAVFQLHIEHLPMGLGSLTEISLRAKLDTNTKLQQSRPQPSTSCCRLH